MHSDYPSKQEIETLLEYNGDLGIFTWRNRAGNRGAGSVAGNLDGTGYIRIRIRRKAYAAHRLALILRDGADFKELDIDHINGNRSDNRLSNLRRATKSDNEQNQRNAQKGNKSGYLGVSWYPRYKKYRAQIKVGSELIFLGYFKTAEEAHNAYLQEKRLEHAGCTI